MSMRSERKIVVVAPSFEVNTGPSNSLVFLKYIPYRTLIFYARRSHLVTELTEFGNPMLVHANLNSLNHYRVSRLINNFLRKHSQSVECIITLSPEYMIFVNQRFLDKTIAIPQGYPELPVTLRFERDPLYKPTFWISFMEQNYILNKVGGVGAISKYMYNKFYRYVKPKRIALIYNPVKEYFFSYGCYKKSENISKSKKVRLIYVGLLIKRKGVDKLLEFFPYVLKEFRDAELHIVGDGPLKVSIEKTIKRANLKKRVYIHGKLPDDTLLQLYLTSTVFVTASYWEGFCLPVAEAITLGIPSVVRSVYALKEHVELGYAAGFERDDPQEFIKALGKVMDNYEKMSINGCEVARKLYHPEVVARRVLHLLHKLSDHD